MENKKVIKSDNEWGGILSPLQFNILRKKGTEPAGSSKIIQNKEVGTYHCVACDNLLFLSEAKYNSGTGWPSFTKPATETSVLYDEDPNEIAIGSEVLCWRCEGHLGHVFGDGPVPTRKRFCMNGAVLKFKIK